MGGSSRRIPRRVAVVAGLVLAATATATAVGVAQPAPWRVVQASDGSLYVLAAGQRFSLEPDSISDDELATYTDGGDLGSTLPSPATGLGPAAVATAMPGAAPVATVAPAPPAPAAPAAPAVAATPAGVALGSRANPVPLGTPAPLADGWQLTVTAAQPDATRDLLARNPGRPPLPSGYQLFLASVRLANTGSAPQAFHAAVRLRSAGLAPAPYIAFSDACGSIPDPLSDAPVAAGQTISGNVCWMVQAQDAPTLVLFDAPPLLAADTAAVTRTYFALRR